MTVMVLVVGMVVVAVLPGDATAAGSLANT